MFTRIVKTHHEWLSSKQVIKADPVFIRLAEKELPYGEVKRISDQTYIKYETMRTWRQHLLTDPEWRPYEALGVTTLPKEAEEELARNISVNYLGRSIPLSQGDVQDMAITVYQNLGRNEVHRDRFAASNKWAMRFRRDFKFSLRSPHRARRNTIDPIHVGMFIQKLRNAIANYHPSHILNMDETCLHIVAEPRYTFCSVGASEVPGGVGGDEKKCFTAIGTISYDGNVLPSCFIAKGTSDLCHQQFGDEYTYENNDKIFHSHNGWTTKQVMDSYLEWLRSLYGDEPLVLVLDVFSAHRHIDVKNKAQELNIELIYVPANGTSTYQPLDRKIYGPLKQRIKKLYEIDRKRIHTGQVWTIEEAAKVFSRQLRSLNPRTYLHAWEIPGLTLAEFDNENFDGVDEGEEQEYEDMNDPAWHD